MNKPIPRSTSLAAWQGLLTSDKLSKLYREVLRALYHNGPSTAKEIEFHSKKPGIWKRTSELRDTGYIIESSKRKCAITKEVVIEWCLPETPPDVITTQRVFYTLEAVVCFKNKSWSKLPYCISVRRQQSLKPGFERAVHGALQNVEHVKIVKHTLIKEADYKAEQRANPHRIIHAVRETE